MVNPAKTKQVLKIISSVFSGLIVGFGLKMKKAGIEVSWKFLNKRVM